MLTQLVVTVLGTQLSPPQPLLTGNVVMTDLSFQNHVDIGIGDKITVKLALTPSTGDAWTCTWTNGRILAGVGEPQFVSNSQFNNAFGNMVFVVRGRREGSTMLNFIRRRGNMVMETLQCLVCVDDGQGQQTVNVGPQMNNGQVNIDSGDILQVVLPTSGGKWSIVSQPSGLSLLLPGTGNTNGYPSGDWSNQYYRFKPIGPWSGFLNLKFTPNSAQVQSSTFDVYVNIRSN